MKLYHWVKRTTVILTENKKITKAKIAFKTKETDWLNTKEPVIIPFSIHSSFHKGIEGSLKISAFLATLKKHVSGRITIILMEKAHAHALSLKFQNCHQKAYEVCLNEAQELAERFRDNFKECNVVYWHSYIQQDPKHAEYSKLIHDLYQKDAVLKKIILEDAEFAYTCERQKEFPDKELFLKKTTQDLLELSIDQLVLSNKGYRYLFYPGKYLASFDYINQALLSGAQIVPIKVFLSIENKTISEEIVEKK